MTILELTKKKKNHKSEQPIDLGLINVDQIVVSKHSDGGFKYFICYKEGKIVKPLCIILLQTTGYVKYFCKRRKKHVFHNQR